MQNDPKWTDQMWVMPHEVRLERHGEKWQLTMLNGIVLAEIDPDRGKRLVEAIISYHKWHYELSVKKPDNPGQSRDSTGQS